MFRANTSPYRVVFADCAGPFRETAHETFHQALASRRHALPRIHRPVVAVLTNYERADMNDGLTRDERNELAEEPR